MTTIRSRWLAQLLSTEAADRPRAQAAVRDLYAAAGFEPPRFVFWFNSPFDACWANALLSEGHSSLWSQLLAGLAQIRVYREKIEQVRADLCSSADGKEWNVLAAAIGRPMSSRIEPSTPPSAGASSVPFKIILARMQLYGGAPPYNFDESDTLVRAETRLLGPAWGVLNSQMKERSVNSFLAASFFTDYSFSMMAADEQQIGTSTPPAILAAAWAVAQSCGPWWPFANAVLLTERPAEIHLNERSLLHRGDGPAAVYRDGAAVYAWNGKPLPARWILQQETLTTRELKEFDADFREYVAGRVGIVHPKTAGRKKASTVLKLDLADAPLALLEQLRQHNKGSLPLFDRYAAGEHEQVWKDLVALGPVVRQDPHAADALAVAYETMGRVAANVRTVVARLNAMHYEFKTEAKRVDDWVHRAEGAISLAQHSARNVSSSPHVQNLLKMVNEVQATITQQVDKAKKSPRDEMVRTHIPSTPHVRKQLARLEKVAGVLPLSLRVFYEVVGSVDWRGRHPALAPQQGSICPDPLVVFPLDDVFEELKQRPADEGENVLMIAPDDLHKSDISGGEPYEIAVPDLRADGELLNESHRLLFVDYLRLCFRFGGFPGYDHIDQGLPSEIETLRQGLLAF